MEKKTLKLGVLLFSLFVITACSSDDRPDVKPPTVTIDNPDQDVDQFIWGGLNAVYLYKEDVNDLANNRFGSQEELFKFLNKFSSPQETFNGLLSKRNLVINNEQFPVDPFSFLIEDFTIFEQGQQGISKSNGMEFGLIQAGNTSSVLGYVRLVFPGTSAESEGLKRGMYFDAVDGVKLTINTNFNAVFSPDSYTLDLVSYDGANITSLNKTVSLAKLEYTENPIYLSKTLDHEGQKIGYLMYNDFRFPFDEQLNEAFGQFKTDGITDLVLDLRYNPGGRVTSSIILSSLISGESTDKVFSRELWNPELQAEFEATNPDRLVNKFTDQTLDGTPLNTLNGLSRVIVLTTDRSASASELVINGLEPYMDVIQIGETTSGKYQASITLYDSEGFVRDGANSDHTIAIQPLVLQSANANGVTDYAAGLFPDINFREVSAAIAGTNLGQIGEPNEVFLKVALDYITDGTIPVVASSGKSSINYKIDWDAESTSPMYQKMYIDIEKYKDVLRKNTLE